MSSMDMRHWNLLSINTPDPDLSVEKHESKAEKIHHKREKIYVGGAFENVYLTWRQSQCMLLFLEGKTQREVSIELGISLRTIERYTKDMCVKMECKDKGHLINKMSETNFHLNAIDID